MIAEPDSTILPHAPPQLSLQGLHERGLRLAAGGRPADAIPAFRRAVAFSPRDFRPRLNLGVSLARAGLEDDALAEFDQVVEGWPAYPEGHLNRGKSLAAAKRHREAAEEFRQSLALCPTSVDALNGLGLSLTHLGQAAAATVALRQAVRIDPAAAGAWSNLGFALATLGRYSDADRAFDEALRLEPSLPEAHVNRGNSLKERGRLTEAIACYDLALLLNQDAGSARWNRSLALLQQGDFARGWEEYESRWDRGQGRRGGYVAPVWDGQSAAGKTILVHSEQGLGDMVMFARYASVLKRAGATVLFETPSPLVAVFSRCPGIDRVIAEGTPLPHIDAVVAAMSLPRFFNTRVDAVPADIPYLHADSASVAGFRQRFPDDVRLTVGLVWQGNPSHPWDRHRSIALLKLTPLAAVPGVRFVALQRGPGREQLARCPFPVDDLVSDNPSEAGAVADLAAAIAAVDLLITVDTLPAHLAGAMGVPVWVLLSTMVDWRWMSDRTDSPWYPSMRLFRQRDRDDWTPVIADVAEQLKRLASTRSTTHAKGQS